MSDATLGTGTLGTGTLGALETLVPRLLTDIDGDNAVEVGGIGFVVTTDDLDTNPSTQIVTLGGQALVVIDWNSGDPIVGVPVDIQIKWGRTDLDLVITDDTGSVTLSNITLLTEAGWEYVEFSGTVPAAGAESGYGLVQADLTYDMVAGDQWLFKSETGLIYDTETLPRLTPPATLTSEYRVWNDTLEAISVKTAYTIAQKPLLSSGGFTA